MNQLNIIGNLVRDPETRQVGEKSVCTFTLAVNRRQHRDAQNNQPDADFFRVSVWGKSGESCQKYLTKGRKVAVTGSVSVHAFSGQDGTPKASLEVFAQSVEFLSTGSNGGQTESAENGGTPVNIDESELPF